MIKIEGKLKIYLIVFIVSGIISGALFISTGIIDIQKIKKLLFSNRYEEEWFYPENFTQDWYKS